jgi:hypothetical protein
LLSTLATTLADLHPEITQRGCYARQAQSPSSGPSSCYGDALEVSDEHDDGPLAGLCAWRDDSCRLRSWELQGREGDSAV